MEISTRVLVAYYSSTGSVHRLAQSVVAGAEKAGAVVRLRRVPELAPRAAIETWPSETTRRKELRFMSDRSQRRRGAHLRRAAIAYATLALAVSIVPTPASAGDLDARAAACEQRFTGGPGEDTIRGNRNDNVICGLRGNDRLFGRPGADVLRGGAGFDHINGEEGRDTVLGGPAGDNLFGGASADRVYGESGNDTLWGGRGDDRLFGGEGNDVFRPRAGVDVVRGGPGDDWIDLTHRDRFDTHDSATCGDGLDTVLVDAGGDGQGGRDTVSADCETVIEE